MKRRSSRGICRPFADHRYLPRGDRRLGAATDLMPRLEQSHFPCWLMDRSTEPHDANALETLRRFAQHAYDTHQQPIHGLLLGHRDASSTVIKQWIPSVNLPTEKERLRAAIALASAEAKDKKLVGWFCS